jgi:hypothetical protein
MEAERREYESVARRFEAMVREHGPLRSYRAPSYQEYLEYSRWSTMTSRVLLHLM